MKIMYLNLYCGVKEEERFVKVVEFIKKYKPDILGLSELNNWDKDNLAKLKRFKEMAGFKEHVFCQARTGFNIGIFSNKKVLDSQILTEGMWHGAILAKFKESNEEFEAVLTHLSPENEDFRLKEIEIIKNKIDISKKIILMGDLNSLSPKDNYAEKELLKEMKNLGIKKFGIDKIRFDAIKEIQKIGFIDSLKLFTDKFEYSVPTEYNKDSAHFTKLRLDYMFVTKLLKEQVKNTKILRDKETNNISDHFPILMELE